MTAASDHALLRNLAAPVRIAAGEHIFDPALAYHYLEKHAIDILQLDVTWCDGIRTAAALGFAALQHDVVFAPHSSGIQPWAMHLLSTFCPTGPAEVIADVGAAASSGQRWSAPVVGDLPGVDIVAERLSGSPCNGGKRQDCATNRDDVPLYDACSCRSSCTTRRSAVSNAQQ